MAKISAHGEDLYSKLLVGNTAYVVTAKDGEAKRLLRRGSHGGYTLVKRFERGTKQADAADYARRVYGPETVAS